MFLRQEIFYNLLKIMFRITKNALYLNQYNSDQTFFKNQNISKHVV